MVAKVIDGVRAAQEIRRECKGRTARLFARWRIVPGLAVILVGDDPASSIYVRNKIKACEEVGIWSVEHRFPSNVDQRTVLRQIAELNDDPSVHGILVQLPLPQHFDMSRILQTISVDKDVDGFHLYNVGSLVVGETVFPPCTPYGRNPD
jgi:methylenetetrahydrofolate dehydrogenase (NADP+) / methenyltetrahydrofolate cyclohydrolase